MARLPIQQLFSLAYEHHQSGRLPEAEPLYRQVLAQRPNHAGALHYLGLIAHQMQRHALAVDLIRRSIAFEPNDPFAQNNMGNALLAQRELDQAIEAYRRAILLAPENSLFSYNLGNALTHKGEIGLAIVAYRQAILLKPNYAEAHYNLGKVLGDRGQLDEAVAAYRAALAAQPNKPEAHNNLGNVLKKKGQLDEAVAEFRQTIVLKPHHAGAYMNLGNTLGQKGQLAEAIAAYRKAITLRPDFAEAYSHLGSLLKENGQLNEAATAYRKAIAIDPNSSEACNNLGNVLSDSGKNAEAIAAYCQAITLRPDCPEAYNNLGIALGGAGRSDDAIAAFGQAIALRPNYPGAHNNLGIALDGARRSDEAIAAFRQAIALNPDYPEAYNNLGRALTKKDDLDAAVAACRQAIILKPGYADAHSNLGNALKDRGQVAEAIAAYRQGISFAPGDALIHSNLIYAFCFHVTYDAHAIYREACRWNEQHARPIANQIELWRNDPNPGRRLRIGCVSPDFRNHCQSFFSFPLLSAHDRSQVEVFCYADVARPDGITLRQKALADHWRDATGQSDDDLAQIILQDRIDILVDLTMHMANNRLLVFARKPAPVQACWLAYPGSTGMTAMDYRLSDPYLDPPGSDESVYSEETIRLHDTFWCYDPIDGHDVPANELPALDSSMITFGCLNNFCKINDRTLALWTQVLQQVANSRAIVLAPEGSARQWVLDRVGQGGIDPERIEFVPRQSRRNYLETYHRIDIGLDSFPYNGHTTSLDSFWMGVPIVTLVGKTLFSRAGWSELSNLGLPELAAHTPDQFVQIAVDLARDLPRLQSLRKTLRQRMKQSPLMDAPRFARNIEAAYRQMWQTWCETKTAPG